MNREPIPCPDVDRAAFTQAMDVALAEVGYGGVVQENLNGIAFSAPGGLIPTPLFVKAGAIAATMLGQPDMRMCCSDHAAVGHTSRCRGVTARGVLAGFDRCMS